MSEVCVQRRVNHIEMHLISTVRLQRFAPQRSSTAHTSLRKNIFPRARSTVNRLLVPWLLVERAQNVPNLIFSEANQSFCPVGELPRNEKSLGLFFFAPIFQKVHAGTHAPPPG